MQQSVLDGAFCAAVANSGGASGAQAELTGYTDLGSGSSTSTSLTTSSTVCAAGSGRRLEVGRRLPSNSGVRFNIKITLPTSAGGSLEASRLAFALEGLKSDPASLYSTLTRAGFYEAVYTVDQTVDLNSLVVAVTQVANQPSVLPTSSITVSSTRSSGATSRKTCTAISLTQASISPNGCPEKRVRSI